MKRRVLSCFMAAVMLICVGCSGSGSSADSSESSDGYTKEVKFDNVTIYLPEDATETDDSTADCKWYDTSFGKIGIDISMSAKNDWHAVDIIESWKKNTKTTKNFKQIMIDNEKALSFECESGDEKQPSVCIGFNTSGAHSLTILIRCKESMERANEEYEKLLKHITIDSSRPTQTTTTTTTTQEESSTESKEPPVDTYSKKETIDNVAFYVPESAISKVEQGVTFYQTSWGHIGVSQAIGTKCSYHSDYYIEKLSEGQDWKNIKKIYVQSSPALYYETKHPAGYDIRVLMNAAQGDVIFAISSTYSYEHARMQYEEFIKHITIKETYKTSTKSETVTTRSNVSIEYQNALNSAKSYLRSMAFSRKGLIEQLKYEKYSTAAATYAVDNCGANWNEQAVKSAKSYLRSMAFSKQELIEQLEFEGFTKAQAQYGVNAVYK